jgi:hypothetical protein|tara:strand:- start:17 stop:412 length:396 start_codon:yes stop_codon:yes gene_type:complete
MEYYTKNNNDKKDNDKKNNDGKDNDENQIDFELDLTTDKEIQYFYNNRFIKPNDIIINSNIEIEENNELYKQNINRFFNKLVDFGFFLSGFVIFYVILKIKDLYKKETIHKNYNKKIYKKNKINNEDIKHL